MIMGTMTHPFRCSQLMVHSTDWLKATILWHHSEDANSSLAMYLAMKYQIEAIPKSPTSGGSMLWLAAVLISWPFPEIHAFLCLLSEWHSWRAMPTPPNTPVRTHTPMTLGEQCLPTSTSPTNTGQTNDNDINISKHLLNTYCVSGTIIVSAFI